MANTSAVPVCTLAVSALQSPVLAQKFAIVGKYAENRPFVCHAALLRNNESIEAERMVGVYHMGPPFSVANDCECHLLGQISLTNEEIESIENWSAEVAANFRQIHVKPFQEFVVVPNAVREMSEENRPQRLRFSCIGYVIQAYQEAEVVLLNLDDLPDVDRSDVESAYPDLNRVAGNPRLAAMFGFLGYADLGLPGEGPWKIPLPGYLFHSTARYRSAAPRPEPFVPECVSQARFP